MPGPSVFPSGEPGVSGDFWGSQEGCQGPSRPSGLAFSPGQEQAAGVCSDSAQDIRADSYSKGHSPRRASLPSPHLLMPCADVCAASPLGEFP